MRVLWRKNRLRTWVLAGMAVAVLASAVAAAQAATGTVKGSVRRPERSTRRGGEGRDRQRQRLEVTAGRNKTDQEGAFTISDAPVGDIGVRVYDDTDRVIVAGQGHAARAGETITLMLRTP